MSKEKTHTPGPWERNGARIQGDRAGQFVTLICTLNETDRAANARLIAAAPEMLAALKHVYSLLPSESLFKIIQKAEGGK